MPSERNYRLELGTAENINHEPPYIYDIKDRFQHFYILGKTGAGKSVLMERMVKTDIDYGCAVVYIDPKGTSAKRLYHLIEDKSRILYISIDNPITINPLSKKGYTTDNIIAEFVQILDVLIQLTSSNPESTVLMREIIGNAIHTLKEKHRNLSFLTRLLMFEHVRRGYPHPTPELQEYWQEFDAMDKNIRKNRGHFDSAKRVASRLNSIVSDKHFERFFLGENEFDVAEIVENKKIVLVDTSRMTYEKRIYLSNLVVYAIVSYCEFGKKSGNPLMVYVDEFQTCVSPLFSQLLGLTREYQVGFTLAHHDFEEITPKVLSSVIGNVDNFVIFRCGDNESKKMASVFDLKQTDFSNLKKYTAWVRLGTQNTLTLTDPPLITEAKDIPKSEHIPTEGIQSFLRHGWIEI
jgi:hypothetical protein